LPSGKARPWAGPSLCKEVLAFLSIMLSAIPGFTAFESINEAPTG